MVLAIFAVCSSTLASENRSTVAAVDIGAARVVNVAVRPGVNLVSAVRQADPSGKWAMAAALYRSQEGDLLAVDASRLAAVAAWPPGLTAESARAVGRYLTPTTTAPVAFTGASLGVTTTVSPGAPPLLLSATVFNETFQDEQTIVVGTLHPGTGTYFGRLDGFCDSTCRLVNLNPAATSIGAHAPAKVHLTVTMVAVTSARGTSRDLAFGAGHPRSWTAYPSPVAVTTGDGTAGVSFALPTQYLNTQAVLLSPADVPNPIPSVVTDALAAVDAPTPPDATQTVENIDGGSLSVAGEIEAPTLPEIGTSAALVNLPFAQLSQIGLSQAVAQVWLGPGAPSSILHKLRASGVTVRSSESAQTRADALGKGPLALAYIFDLGCAPVAALLAIGATAFALLATGRRRRRDLRALTVVGITRRTVFRSILFETGLVLGVALVLGTVVGIVASRLALSSLPQFPDGTGGVPISHVLPLRPLAVTVLALAVIFALITVSAPFVILRGATFSGAVGGE